MCSFNQVSLIKWDYWQIIDIILIILWCWGIVKVFSVALWIWNVSSERIHLTYEIYVKGIWCCLATSFELDPLELFDAKFLCISPLFSLACSLSNTYVIPPCQDSSDPKTKNQDDDKNAIVLLDERQKHCSNR